ncbi:osteopetrosis-associated transmembrane protein 1 [Aphomia sociella]
MNKLLIKLFVLYFCCFTQSTKVTDNEITGNKLQSHERGYTSSVPELCRELIEDFALYASNFTMCSIKNARPVRLCRHCINQYVTFYFKYQELLNTVVNGTSCRIIYISHDRLDVVLEYHDSILNVWNKGNCNACYDWSGSIPVVSNDTKHFDKMFNETMNCIASKSNTNSSEEICERCMQSYLQLDIFYKSLSKDSVGLDNVCFDIIDSMNTTRFIWSKDLNCCKLRKTPEVIFLVCTGIISLLPILFYVVARFCAPIRALPNILKESRFKQSFLRSSRGRIN